MSKSVVRLGEILPVAVIGGKALALSSLIQAGFNVPSGFVVTTQARKSLAVNKEILSYFDSLGVKRVAVRSSAAAEDGKQDAWAGQLDSFLNVSRNELLEKVALCQSSAGSVRARAYAKQKGLSAGGTAVIVQKMVASDTSGVAFSAHPVTANRQQMVIEAISGLGEKLVSGTATPDTYVIDKETAKVLESYHLAEPVLDSKKVANLAQAISKIENLFGHDVDVEWAFEHNQLYILQSRPITTLS